MQTALVVLYFVSLVFNVVLIGLMFASLERNRRLEAQVKLMLQNLPAGRKVIPFRRPKL